MGVAQHMQALPCSSTQWNNFKEFSKRGGSFSSRRLSSLSSVFLATVRPNVTLLLVMDNAIDFDTENYSAYVFYMKEPKSSLFDIGVYLFLALIIGGSFVALLWWVGDFFTAIIAWQLVGPIIVLLSDGPSELFGKGFATVVMACEELFKFKKPPHSSAHGHTVHTAV